MPKPKTFCRIHPDKRAHAYGMCSNCYSAFFRKKDPAYKARQYKRRRDWYAANREQQLLKSGAYHKANAEKLRKRASENWANLTPEQRWEKNIKSTYGITGEQYYALLASQNGRCGICKKTPGELGEKLAVDHCHKTQLIRGVLCRTCNSLVGWVETHSHLVDDVRSYLTNKFAITPKLRTRRRSASRRASDSIPAS